MDGKTEAATLHLEQHAWRRSGKEVIEALGRRMHVSSREQLVEFAFKVAYALCLREMSKEEAPAPTVQVLPSTIQRLCS